SARHCSARSLSLGRDTDRLCSFFGIGRRSGRDSTSTEGATAPVGLNYTVCAPTQKSRSTHSLQQLVGPLRVRAPDKSQSLRAFPVYSRANRNLILSACRSHPQVAKAGSTLDSSPGYLAA